MEDVPQGCGIPAATVLKAIFVGHFVEGFQVLLLTLFILNGSRFLQVSGVGRGGEHGHASSSRASSVRPQHGLSGGESCWVWARRPLLQGFQLCPKFLSVLLQALVE